MATKNKPTETTADSLQQWIDEAASKAEGAIRRGAELGHGTVLPYNSDLHYTVLEGVPAGQDEPAHTTRVRARLEALGFRDVTADVKAVVGYTHFVVMAIPKIVYRQHIRRERVRRTQELVDRWGMTAPHIHRSLSLS